MVGNLVVVHYERKKKWDRRELCLVSKKNARNIQDTVQPGGPEGTVGLGENHIHSLDWPRTMQLRFGLYLFTVNIVLVVTFPLMNLSFRSFTTSGTHPEIGHNLSMLPKPLTNVSRLLLCSPLDSPVSFVRNGGSMNITVCQAQKGIK